MTDPNSPSSSYLPVADWLAENVFLLSLRAYLGEPSTRHLKHIILEVNKEPTPANIKLAFDTARTYRSTLEN